MQSELIREQKLALGSLTKLDTFRDYKYTSATAAPVLAADLSCLYAMIKLHRGLKDNPETYVGDSPLCGMITLPG